MNLAENILESEAAKNIWAPEKHESSGFYECEKKQTFRNTRDSLQF